jgi:hypothetical protein
VGPLGHVFLVGVEVRPLCLLGLRDARRSRLRRRASFDPGTRLFEPVGAAGAGFGGSDVTSLPALLVGYTPSQPGRLSVTRCRPCPLGRHCKPNWRQFGDLVAGAARGLHPSQPGRLSVIRCRPCPLGRHCKPNWRQFGDLVAGAARGLHPSQPGRLSVIRWEPEQRPDADERRCWSPRSAGLVLCTPDITPKTSGAPLWRRNGQ